jgi:hypothetical protein
MLCPTQHLLPAPKQSVLQPETRILGGIILALRGTQDRALESRTNAVKGGHLLHMAGEVLPRCQIQWQLH